MILFEVKSDGTVRSTPSRVPQGSSLADLVVVTEADYALVTMHLVPPSFEIIEDIQFTPTKTAGNRLWQANLPPSASITNGRLRYQIFLHFADGRVIPTAANSVEILAGVISNMPETAEDLSDYSIQGVYRLLSSIYSVTEQNSEKLETIDKRLDEVQLSTLTIQKYHWEDGNPMQAFGNVSGLFAFAEDTASRKVSILLLPVDNATRVESRSIGIEVTNVTPMTGSGDVTIFFSREGDAPTMDLKYVVIAFSEPNETGKEFAVAAGFIGIGASSTDQLEADVEALKQQTGEAITKHDEDIDEIYGELQNLESIAGANVQAISDIREILKGMGGGPNQDEEQNQKLQQLESNYGELKSVVDELLYVPISIDEFKSSVTSAEKGSTVTETTLSWVLNKDPEAVSLDGVAIEPLESADYTLRDLAITANKKFTLSATDGKKTVTKDASINFYNGVYYGAATVPEAYNSAFMIALGKSGKKVLRGSKLTSFTVTAGAGEYIYYCLPVSMGACSFKVGGFDGGFDLVATLAYTNEYGHTEQYYIYRSANAGLGETNVEVK
jgi:hypothetical protein